MTLAFTKMHGAGNDFVLIDGRTTPLALDAEAIRALADRHTGIGFDQLLSIEPARDGASRWRYGIWNADGDAVGQCGNGVRCVAAWLHRAGLIAAGERVQLQSPSGPVRVRVLDAASVAVDMGAPHFAPAEVPLDAAAEALRYAIEVAGTQLDIGAVSMGNPHAVVEVDDVADPRLARLGPALTAHPRFPEGCNAGFVQRLDAHTVRLRVHERGAGWTQACGTGACAAVAVLGRRGAVHGPVAVHLPGGTLTIEWAGGDAPVWMTGPAAFVFEGSVAV